MAVGIQRDHPSSQGEQEGHFAKWDSSALWGQEPGHLPERR